ncbi:MAG: TIGR00300 family protein, partial [Spirochaetaceae bacterium]|nr:TIGR00300 family protein [Spirochaetaceae bacterium]
LVISVSSVHIHPMVTKTLTHKGHLIDTGQLSSILNLIINEGADYEITGFDVGKSHSDESLMRIVLKAGNEVLLEATAAKLISLGVRAVGETEAEWVEITRDKAAPADFYSTTNHRSEVFYTGKWQRVKDQRMDAAIAKKKSGPVCVKLRDLKTGDLVLLGSSSVRVHLPESESRGADSFAFMNNDVSSERNATQSAEKIAEQIRELREKGGKVVVVAGPVVIHTGGADALASLVKGGWIGGFLGGNAIAVHDLEYRFFGTSLGVNLATGRPTHEGHKNHMMAINAVYNHGSINAMMDAGELKEGLMFEVISSGIPYCLAGSIRDDGPLPETEMDMIKAQQAYADIIAGTDMILMLSTMLHSIGTGNMTPSWVKTVCVDINPAVVTKLSDRGSAQTVGVVSDVGLFLRALAGELESS